MSNKILLNRIRCLLKVSKNGVVPKAYLDEYEHSLTEIDIALLSNNDLELSDNDQEKLNSIIDQL